MGTSCALACSPSNLFIKQVVRVLRVNPLLVTALTAITLGCFVQPALGLFILILSHALCCHNALCRYCSSLNSLYLSLLRIHFIFRTSDTRPKHFSMFV